MRGDGGDGFERLAVAGIERDGGRELVDHAQAGQPFAVAGVGVDSESIKTFYHQHFIRMKCLKAYKGFRSGFRLLRSA